MPDYLCHGHQTQVSGRCLNWNLHTEGRFAKMNKKIGAVRVSRIYKFVSLQGFVGSMPRVLPFFALLLMTN